jgi:DNA repair exonuclease SbcCD nuclease subunit
MRVIITADWHFGYQGRLEDLSWSFKTMLKYCIKNGIKHVFILGDLTEDRRSITHDVSNTITKLLELAYKSDVIVTCLIGNHDMFLRYKWTINSIKPFSNHLNLIDNVVWFELGNRKFWCVPFIEHEQTYMRVINSINEQASEDDVLLTHIGIASAKMNICFLIQNWNIVALEDTVFSKIYAGHFHCTQKVGSKSWYVGSPIPFRFDEGLTEHGFFVYDTVENNHEFVDLFKIGEGKLPPEFITVTSDSIDSIINDCGNNRIKVVLSENDDVRSIKEKLKNAGATSVVTAKPKEEKIEVKDIKIDKSTNAFESWIKHDNPEGLDRKLLIGLEKEIRSNVEELKND